MGYFKKLEVNVNLISWHILSEKSPKPEETKDVPTTKYQALPSPLIAPLVKYINITERIGMRANFTTKEK